MTKHFATPPSVPFPIGEALCRLCAQSGGTCCVTDPDLTYLSFPLSRPEWERLLPYAPLATAAPAGDAEHFALEEAQADRAAETLRSATPAQDGPSGASGGERRDQEHRDRAMPEDGDSIAAPEPNHPDFLTSMRFLFPRQREQVEALFPEGGSHYALRTRADGACVFLGSSGCRLPRSVRPWYCLLFPAWVSHGNLTLFLSPDCLISQKAKGSAHGIGLLDQHPARVRELHAMLCREWGMANAE